MRLLRFIRRNPVAVLGLGALAFVLWIWRDSFSTPPPVGQPPELTKVSIDLPEGWTPPPRGLPLPPGVELPPNPPAPQGTVQAISKLKPGMSRVEVEGLVGAPESKYVSPATVTEGRVTYSTTYEADFGVPATVRPIHTIRPHPKDEPNANSKTRVTLEFDATKPGHPLLRVHYPDPLF